MAEKSLQEVGRPLREQYEKGMSALQRNNLDYAIAIFTELLRKEPAFFDCRQALRATQFKKSGGKTKGFFKKFMGTASQSPLLAKGQIALRTNPREALNVAEQILNQDPLNSPAHKMLAEAAMTVDLPRTAVLSLEIVFKHSPQDKETVLKLGEALAAAGQIARAESICKDLQEAFPRDPEIAQTLKDLSARRTMSEGGYDAASDSSGSYRDMLKDAEEAASLEQGHRQVKSEEVARRLIETNNAQLEKEPHNLRLLRANAELYTQIKEFDRALEFYHQITESEGATDPSLERDIAQTIARKYDHDIAPLDPQKPEEADRIQKLEAEKHEFLLEDSRRRVEKYPNDLQLRFELGQLYMQANRLNEAIQEFQRAQANPHRRIAAMKHLGQCFALRRMYDLAERTLRNALKEKEVFDEEKKELHYLLGTALEEAGKKEEAIEQFKVVYEVDIGYKDVAAKVDAYYSQH